MPTPEVDPWVSPEPLLVGELLPRDPTPRRRNIKTPVAIAAGLAIIALAALVWPGVLSSRSTHVAATKTPTSLGPSKDAQTVQRNGDEPAYGDADSSQLAPGQTTTWDATSYVSSTTRPTATPDRGVWLDSHYADCPSGSSPPASAR